MHSTRGAGGVAAAAARGGERHAVGGFGVVWRAPVRGGGHERRAAAAAHERAQHALEAVRGLLGKFVRGLRPQLLHRLVVNAAPKLANPPHHHQQVDALQRKDDTDVEEHQVRELQLDVEGLRRQPKFDLAEEDCEGDNAQNH